MFTSGHLLFTVISAVIIALAVFVLAQKRPPIRNVYRVCFCLGMLSEVVKLFHDIKIVPVVEMAVEGAQLVYRQRGPSRPISKPSICPSSSVPTSSSSC